MPAPIPTRARAALAVAAVLAAGIGLALAYPAGASGGGTVVLARDVLADLSTLVPLGETDPDRQLQVAVALARPDPAAEQATYQAMYTPGSPSYRHFLTPAGFAARFGVPAASYAAATDFATGHGLQVVQTSRSGEFLLLSGSARQVEQTFAVGLQDFREAAGPGFYANVDPPTVPAGLGITGVLGLNGKLAMHTVHTVPTASAPHGQSPAQGTCLGGTCLGLTTPQDLWSIYHQPDSDKGEGQRMAIFGAGKTAPVTANLRTFESLHKLPRMPISVVSAGNDFKDNTGEVEWDLDTQASTGMSPNALGETLYFGKDLKDASVLAVFTKWADDPNGPLQASASYGECEENPVADLTGNPMDFSASAMFTRGAEAALRKATMEGRTLFASTGDTGSSCPVVPAATLNGLTNELVPIANYPASSPYVVGVGGTVLYGSGGDRPTRRLEYAWTFTGGGTSFIFAKPGYQDGVPAIVGRCLYGVGGHLSNVGKPCRGSPDVAAQSGDVVTNGYGIVANGSTQFTGGGTSLSSPLWLGMWTRLQAAAPPRGVGFANETLYRQFTSPSGGRDFFDIGGGLASPPVGNGIYLSTPGWDYVSGLGAPDLTNLVRDVTGRLTPTHDALPPQAPAGGTGGSASSVDPCQSLFTDPTGDESFLLAGKGKDPQLDLVRGELASTPGDPNLHAVLTLADLRAATPTGAQASEYYLQWTYRGSTYFANGEVDLTGRVSYADGTLDGRVYRTRHADTGRLRAGPGGTVEIDVPLANVGNPKPGDVLSLPVGSTKAEIGVPALGGLPALGGSLQPVDDAGPQHDYRIGAVCAQRS